MPKCLRYKDIIETFLLIDEPKTGSLIPFKLNKTQIKFYNQLKESGIEQGLNSPVRELVLKARRQGFTSLILALFAIDDILSKQPTETMVISYKDDATKTFRKRYKNYILSYFKNKWNITDESQIFEVDSGSELVLRHNKARFYCGTASARVGGRGGTVQKLLFSEAAFYPDTAIMKASEIIEGTMRQVDINSGWIFIESTANGVGNYYHRMWQLAEQNQSRFHNRFFSWMEFYSPEQFELIKSEFTDKRLIPQEYPATPEEAFISSGQNFFDMEKVKRLRLRDPIETIGQWTYYLPYKTGHRYCLGVDVSEGVGNHNSVIVIMDLNADCEVGTHIIKKPDVAATYYSNSIPPDRLAYEIMSGGTRYGNCIAGVERNNHGFATLTVLKGIYFNIYREHKDVGYGNEITERLGWHTNLSSKPRMLYELKQAIDEGLINVGDKTLQRELITYPQYNLNEMNVNEEEEGGHWDGVIALAIAFQMRNFAQLTTEPILKDDERWEREEAFNKHQVFGNL